MHQSAQLAHLVEYKVPFPFLRLSLDKRHGNCYTVYACTTRSSLNALFESRISRVLQLFHQPGPLETEISLYLSRSG
jgi:hypothetical protein